MTKRSRKALIIGAGIAGPVTAIFLKRAGIDAQVFEAWPYSTGIGGGLQIAPNGMHVLAEIGLADEMIRRGLGSRILRFLTRSPVRRLGSINRNMKQRFGQPAVEHAPRHAATRRSWTRPGARMSSSPSRSGWCASRIAPTSRSSRISPTAASAEGDFRDRRRRRAFGGAHACHSRRPEAVRHRPDRLRRFRAAVAARELRRIGQRVDDDVRAKRLFRLRLLQPRSRRRRDVVEHPACAWHRRGDLPRHGSGCAEAASCSTSTPAGTIRSRACWKPPKTSWSPRRSMSRRLPTWSRGRTLLIGDAAHATSPHAGQGASLALEDAMRLGRLMQRGTKNCAQTFENFEERAPAARRERSSRIARRNGNSKREFSATGAWDPRPDAASCCCRSPAKGMDWMYAYDPRGVTSRPANVRPA